MNNNKNSMSQANSFDISDLYQNEESIDLTSYMTPGNLELCDDDLFQSLFPSTTDTDNNVKKEKPDPFEENELGDWWVDSAAAYPSACSSAAQSPVQFFNTPPVTPKSDGHTISPETIHPQVRQDLQAQFSLSRTQLTPMSIAEDHTSVVGNVGANEMAPPQIKNEPDMQILSNRVYFVKSEQDVSTNSMTPKPLLPELVKASPTDPSKYENGIYGNSLKRDYEDDNEKVSAKRNKSLNKDSEEYRMKRERNNIAVRKSRDKAKMKSAETQKKVTELSSENKRLHERVAELTHELNTLKSILKSLPQISK